YPGLGPGSKGDEVLWLQEHLAREFPTQLKTGLFGSQTLGFLRAFQARHGLTATGSTDPATWQALLRLSPVEPDWSASALPAAARPGAGAPPPPPSAAVPARRYEIPDDGSDLAAVGRSHREP